MKQDKKYNRATVQSWIDRLRSTNQGQYHLDKLVETLGSNADEICDTMNAKQLRAVCSLMANAYHYGCNETRDHIRSLKEDSRAYDLGFKTRGEYLERKSQFKLIAGGIQ